MSAAPAVTTLAERLARAGGGSVHAIILYGSHLLGTQPDRHSAVDFVVIVDSYRRFYEAFDDAGELHRPVWLVRLLARVLAPNVLSFAPDEGRGGIAKFLLVTRHDFERALGPHPPDHFLLGRMIQNVAVVWASSEEDAGWVRERLSGAHARVLTWVAPYLEGSFDAEELGRRALEVCYRGELRPEAGDRAERVFEAQAAHFRQALAEGLERGVASGEVVREGDRFRLAQSVPPAVRRRWRRHFARSKARATARWFKHTVTFANWLPYVVRKVERHTGEPVELTRMERRLPIIFLWPRVVRVLTNRPDRAHSKRIHGP